MLLFIISNNFNFKFKHLNNISYKKPFKHIRNYPSFIPSLYKLIYAVFLLINLLLMIWLCLVPPHSISSRSNSALEYARDTWDAKLRISVYTVLYQTDSQHVSVCERTAY